MRLFPVYPVSCALFCALLLAGGCVTREVVEMRPRDDVTLMVARSGAAVTIQWRSDIGRIYTVLYSDRMGGGAQWRPLPGAVNIPGTGELILLQDEVTDARQRYYRLHIEMPQARKPAR